MTPSLRELVTHYLDHIADGSWVERLVREHGLPAVLEACVEALRDPGVVTAVSFLLIKMTIGLRPTEEVEREGLDTNEHGERAYDS